MGVEIQDFEAERGPSWARSNWPLSATDDLTASLDPTQMAVEVKAAAKAAGAVTLNYGLFVNAMVGFFIIAFAVYWVVKAYNKAADRLIPKEELAPVTKACPDCCTQIPVAARRCPACTSMLD